MKPDDTRPIEMMIGIDEYYSVKELKTHAKLYPKGLEVLKFLLDNRYIARNSWGIFTLTKRWCTWQEQFITRGPLNEDTKT